MKHVSRCAPILIGGNFDCPAGFSVIIEHCSATFVASPTLTGFLSILQATACFDGFVAVGDILLL